MSQNYFFPKGFTVITIDAVGSNGAAIPTSSILVAGKGPTGLLTPLALDASGNLNSIPLPTGAATAAKQDTGNTSLASIDTKLTSQATAAKQDTGNTSLSSIDGKITACNTGAVVVSSSALPTGAATLTAQGTGNTSLASIDGKITACNTGAVVVSSSALPTGAALDATVSTMSGKLPATLGAKTTANSMAVNIASDQVVNIAATALPLPTGAATAANQTLATITSGALYVDLSTINGSGGAIVTVAASIAAAVKLLSFTNVSGNNIGVYDASTLVCVIGAGADNQCGVNIASSHNVGLRMMGAAAGASGDILCLNLQG